MTTYQWTIFQPDGDADARPVLVVSAEPLNERFDLVLAVPVLPRSNERLARVGEVLLPAGTGGLPADSFALCYQVQPRPKAALTRPLGPVTSPVVQEEVQWMLSLCLDLS